MPCLEGKQTLTPQVPVHCVAVCGQEMEHRAREDERDAARNAVGVLPGGDDRDRRRRQYAADLEDQVRAKKVTT